jgi:hypothetical protein
VAKGDIDERKETGYFNLEVPSLLINMPIPLQLIPVLDNHCRAQQQKHINSNNPKRRRKNNIQIGIRKHRKRTNTALFLARSKGISAYAVDDERRRLRIGVSAALEALLKEGLDVGGQTAPDAREVLAGLEGVEPDKETEGEGEERAEDGEHSLET